MIYPHPGYTLAVAGRGRSGGLRTAVALGTPIIDKKRELPRRARVAAVRVCGTAARALRGLVGKTAVGTGAVQGYLRALAAGRQGGRVFVTVRKSESGWRRNLRKIVSPCLPQAESGSWGLPRPCFASLEFLACQNSSIGTL